VPDAAKGVVFDVAQRAYSNVTGVSSEGVGPFSRSLPSAGVSLTAANRRELRQLAGRGGAFTIDPTPADAGANLPLWDRNITWFGGEPDLFWSGPTSGPVAPSTGGGSTPPASTTAVVGSAIVGTATVA
jgi:hypothetical protein